MHRPPTHGLSRSPTRDAFQHSLRAHGAAKEEVAGVSSARGAGGGRGLGVGIDAARGGSAAEVWGLDSHRRKEFLLSRSNKFFLKLLRY